MSAAEFHVGFRVTYAPTLSLLESIAARATDLRPAFQRANVEVQRFFSRQFATSGKAGGEEWAPLAPATAIRRIRARGGNRGGVTRPLWDTGRLRASLAKPSVESIIVYGRQRYQRGSSVPYLLKHMRGYSIQRWGRVRFREPVKVPARPVLPRQGLPVSVQRSINAIIRAHIGNRGPSLPPTPGGE